jgi:ribosomal protein S18 acetylase RimI-like enzyme
MNSEIPANLQVVTGNIPVEIYTALRLKTGLSAKSKNAAEAGLKNSLHAVMIKNGDEVIAMGRIIGDGGCFCQVVDICVLPEYQGKGIGRMIMENLTAFIQTKLPATCYVSLLADRNASHLYEKFGFRDTLPASKGMYLKV